MCISCAVVKMSVAAAEIWKRAREAWRGWGPDLSFDLL